MTADSLMALSPLDGRYISKIDNLRPIMSEYGLIYFRLTVEINWLLQLCAHNQIEEAIQLTDSQTQFLKDILVHFNEEEAVQIKTIEKSTNHDVKAVEYYLQDKLSANESLSSLIPFIHFAATSEDINNISYAMMIKEARSQCLQPHHSTILGLLEQLADNTQDMVMLSRTHGQRHGGQLRGSKKRYRKYSHSTDRCFDSNDHWTVDIYLGSVWNRNGK